MTCCPSTCKKGATAFTARPLQTMAPTTRGCDKEEETTSHCVTKESWSIGNANDDDDDGENNDNNDDASTLSSVIDVVDSAAIIVDPINKKQDKQACVAIFVVINGFGLTFFLC